MLKELDRIYKSITSKTNDSVCSNVLLVCCILKYYYDLYQITQLQKYSYAADLFLKICNNSSHDNNNIKQIITNLEEFNRFPLKYFPLAVADTLYWLQDQSVSNEHVVQLITFFKNIKLIKPNAKTTSDATKIFIYINTLQCYKNNVKELSIENLIARLAMQLNHQDTVSILDPVCQNGETLVLTCKTLQEKNQKVKQIAGYENNKRQVECACFNLLINGFIDINIGESTLIQEELEKTNQSTYHDIVVAVLKENNLPQYNSETYCKQLVENIINQIDNGFAIIGFYTKISNKVLTPEMYKNLISCDLIRGVINFSVNHVAKDYTLMIIGKNILEKNKVMFLNLHQVLKLNSFVNNDDLDTCLLNAIKNNSLYRSITDIVANSYSLAINDSAKSKHILPQLDLRTLLQKQTLIQNIKNELDSTSDEIDNLKLKLRKYKERSN